MPVCWNCSQIMVRVALSAIATPPDPAKGIAGAGPCRDCRGRPARQALDIAGLVAQGSAPMPEGGADDLASGAGRTQLLAAFHPKPGISRWRARPDGPLVFTDRWRAGQGTWRATALSFRNPAAAPVSNKNHGPLAKIRAGCGPRPWQFLVGARSGLWASYRGALGFADALDRLPKVAKPCDSCAQPCATACPVGALTPAGYDTDACHAYLDTKAGQDCMTNGCAVRRACPVSAAFGRDPAQSAFHMRHFHR